MNEEEELSKVYQAVAERSSKILGEFAQKQAQSMSSAVRDEMGIAKAFMDLYARMAANPAMMPDWWSVAIRTLRWEWRIFWQIISPCRRSGVSCISIMASAIPPM